MRYLTLVCLFAVAALAMPGIATVSRPCLSSGNGDAD